MGQLWGRITCIRACVSAYVRVLMSVCKLGLVCECAKPLLLPVHRTRLGDGSSMFSKGLKCSCAADFPPPLCCARLRGAEPWIPTSWDPVPPDGSVPGCPGAAGGCPLPPTCMLSVSVCGLAGGGNRGTESGIPLQAGLGGAQGPSMGHADGLVLPNTSRQVDGDAP